LLVHNHQFLIAFEIMQLYFIDDSGTVSSPNKIIQEHFVLGGLSIPEEKWHHLEKEFSLICEHYRISGEVKWRFFGQRIGREDKDNTLSHLTIAQKDELRKALLATITKCQSIKVIVGVVHLPTIYSLPDVNSAEDVYSRLYEPLTENFQYHLQDLSRKTGSKINGLIISDHRNPAHDRNLRDLHISLLNFQGNRKQKYENLIENLFLSPSHHSIGIQFADLISGAVFRYFEHKDERWFRLIEPNLLTGFSGEAEGHGLIKIPEDWKENDAESKKLLEPAIMTQSQRNPHSSLDTDY
jgi:Protein of unknown function (DUF3800)